MGVMTALSSGMPRQPFIGYTLIALSVAADILAALFDRQKPCEAEVWRQLTGALVSTGRSGAALVRRLYAGGNLDPRIWPPKRGPR